MSYEVAYEISKFQMPWDIILMSVGAIVAIFVAWDGITEYKSRIRNAGTVIKMILGVLALIVFGLLAISSVSYGGNENKAYSELYYSGQYEVVEGEVYDLEFGNGQTYKVDGVEFDVSRADETVDFIEHEGVNVRICYIYDEDLAQNVILKMEIEEGYMWMASSCKLRNCDPLFT